MNFDNFDSICFRNRESLLDNCKAAERNIKLSPYTTIANARPALELLCKGLMKERGIKAEADVDGTVGLYRMIDACLEHDVFQGGDEATMVRKSGNDALHIKVKDRFHVVNEANVAKAMDIVKALYVVMQQAFGLTGEQYAFDEKKIPFDEYEVQRIVPKADNEVIFGDCNYFVSKATGEHYYFQIFPRGSDDFMAKSLSARSRDAGKEITKDKKRRSYLLEAENVKTLPEGSDRSYIVYRVWPDSFLLSEMKQPMTAGQAVRVGLDLIHGLLEMKRIGQGIHHRNIQPGCVMITPDEDVYMAGLVNLETAKLPGYEYTVFGSIKELFRENPYMPRELRNYKEGQQEIDWEKVDLYSVAKIMLYCVDPGLVALEVDADRLYDIFSDELVESFRVIFESSLSESYTLKEFRGILEDEIE